VFINDLAERLASRVQLTSDGLKAYIEAVKGANHTKGREHRFRLRAAMAGKAVRAGSL
jgi:hypothetical protein